MTINDGQQAITTAVQVNARPEFQNLTQPQRDWVVRLAEDPAVATTIQEAIAVATRPRTTVVGAVDGGAGAREFQFLGCVWEHNPKAIAYDPQMHTGVVRHYLNQGGQGNTLLLAHASITQLGAHVPDVDVLIPHPGPWVNSIHNDLATCLETVLGQNSHAYVLTDNEPGQGYQQRLSARIAEINQANTNVPNYLPLAVQVTTPTGEGQLERGSLVELGGVPLLLGHDPGYRVIHVTR